jgi:quercetin dioxygenase-like cupin family protein
MNKMVLFLALAFSSLLAFSGANAGTGKATTLMTKDLPDFPGKEGMVEIVEFAPGEVSQPHRHNADLFVYVLEGSIITQVKGGNPQTVHAGDVFFESPTDVHSVSRNASETQPAKLLVFYVKVKGAPPTVLLGDGEKQCVSRTPTYLDIAKYAQSFTAAAGPDAAVAFSRKPASSASSACCSRPGSHSSPNSTQLGGQPDYDRALSRQ